MATNEQFCIFAWKWRASRGASSVAGRGLF